VTLSDEQASVRETALAGESAFFSGAAGTGKSVLLREIVRRLRAQYGADHVGVAASTGMAACAIGGVTLHSFFGVGLARGTIPQLCTHARRNFPAMRRVATIDVLVVDEISMVKAELWEKLDAVAREFVETDMRRGGASYGRGRRRGGRPSSAPFGGIQLVVCGDFAQLPPVFRDETPGGRGGGRGGYRSRDAEPPGELDRRLCFETPLWNRAFGANQFKLTRIFRQKDDALITVLNVLLIVLVVGGS